MEQFLKTKLWARSDYPRLQSGKLSSLEWGIDLNHWSGITESKLPDFQRTPNPRKLLITEDFHEGLNLCTKHRITQLPTASSAGHLTQTKSERKAQKQSSADRIPTGIRKYTTSHSPSIRGKKQNTTTHLLPLEYKHKSLLPSSQHTLLNQPFPLRAKAKRKKEHDPKTWEKETWNRIS